MWDFVVGLVKVFVGAFVPFLIINALFNALVMHDDKKYVWAFLVGVLAFISMTVSYWVGNSITVAFWTVALLGLAVGAIDSNYSPALGMLRGARQAAKLGVWFLVAGGLCGWLWYAKVVTIT